MLITCCSGRGRAGRGRMHPGTGSPRPPLFVLRRRGLPARASPAETEPGICHCCLPPSLLILICPLLSANNKGERSCFQSGRVLPVRTSPGLFECRGTDLWRRGGEAELVLVLALRVTAARMCLTLQLRMTFALSSRRSVPTTSPRNAAGGSDVSTECV